MSDLRKFFFEDLVLTVCSEAFLVKVQTGKRRRGHQLADLPDWVFDSRNAVWLTEEEAPLSVRGNHGDLIRKRLDNELHKNEETRTR